MAGLDGYEGEKISCPTRVQSLYHPAFSESLHNAIPPPLVSVIKIKYKTLSDAYFKAMKKLNPKIMSFNNTVLTPSTVSFVCSNTS
jgi:hypothetical protein